jgi:uncharacterized protein (DUF433 family)
MNAEARTDDQIDFRPDAGVLRTRLVAALADVSPQRLGRWHRSGLLPAHTLPGGHGSLRLYSWIDYMKARAARKLLDAGVQPHHLHNAIAYLEHTVPRWYLVPLREFAGKVLPDSYGLYRTAARASQFAIPEIVESVPNVLAALEKEGPLGVLHRYEDVIDMNPRILGGNPTIKGTGLEARFVFELAARGVPHEQITESYGVSSYQIERAITFTEAAA